MPHLQKSSVTKSFLCIIKEGGVDNLREEVKKQNNTLIIGKSPGTEKDLQ